MSAELLGYLDLKPPFFRFAATPFLSTAFLYLQTETDGNAPVVYVYHVGGSQWLGNKIDFSNLLKRPCVEDSSDYAEWFPGWSTSDQGRCLLGRSYTLHHRNPCQLCYNGVGTANGAQIGSYQELLNADESNSYACRCTAFDFHCSPGFYRKDPLDENSPCVYDYAYKAEVDCQVRAVGRSMKRKREVAMVLV